MSINQIIQALRKIISVKLNLMRIEQFPVKLYVRKFGSSYLLYREGKEQDKYMAGEETAVTSVNHRIWVRKDLQRSFLPSLRFMKRRAELPVTHSAALPTTTSLTLLLPTQPFQDEPLGRVPEVRRVQRDAAELLWDVSRNTYQESHQQRSCEAQGPGHLPQYTLDHKASLIIHISRKVQPVSQSLSYSVQKLRLCRKTEKLKKGIKNL